MLLIILFVISSAVIIMSVNWTYVYELSNRGVNYTIIPIITRYGAWLTGFGFSITDNAEGWGILGINVMDSFYLTTILQSGLIGFSILFSGILTFTFIYFGGIRTLSKLQILTGAFLIVMFYYGIFESVLFNFKPLILLGWVMLILCMNDKMRPKIQHKRFFTCDLNCR